MKLLVLAQTPPPQHGQSLMVQTLVEGLPAHGIAVHHVNLRLSRDQGDIGRWRTGKVWAAIRAGLAARRSARAKDCDTLYYVPAPGKRGALWRDLVVLGLARPACRRLVLHWHASGLGDWLKQKPRSPERRLAQTHLGGADLSLVLSEDLRADAAMLNPVRIAVVPNGIADPGAAPRPPARPGGTRRILFLGSCAVEKGVLDLLNAFTLLRGKGADVELVLAGTPPSPGDAAEIDHAVRRIGGGVTLAGFVGGEAKDSLLRRCDVFCLPSFYPHEAQPLAVLDALAHDLPVVATRWRGIPAMLPPGNPVVAPHDPQGLSVALAAALMSPPPPGANRAHFLAHFTRERHLGILAETLRSLG